MNTCSKTPCPRKIEQQMINDARMYKRYQVDNSPTCSLNFCKLDVESLLSPKPTPLPLRHYAGIIAEKVKNNLQSCNTVVTPGCMNQSVQLNAGNILVVLRCSLVGGVSSCGPWEAILTHNSDGEWLAVAAVIIEADSKRLRSRIRFGHHNMICG